MHASLHHALHPKESHHHTRHPAIACKLICTSCSTQRTRGCEDARTRNLGGLDDLAHGEGALGDVELAPCARELEDAVAGHPWEDRPVQRCRHQLLLACPTRMSESDRARFILARVSW
eukprot:1998347-Rhodomonas_salina.2